MLAAPLPNKTTFYSFLNIYCSYYHVCLISVNHMDTVVVYTRTRTQSIKINVIDHGTVCDSLSYIPFGHTIYNTSTSNNDLNDVRGNLSAYQYDAYYWLLD